MQRNDNRVISCQYSYKDRVIEALITPQPLQDGTAGEVIDFQMSMHYHCGCLCLLNGVKTLYWWSLVRKMKDSDTTTGNTALVATLASSDYANFNAGQASTEYETLANVEAFQINQQAVCCAGRRVPITWGANDNVEVVQMPATSIATTIA